MPLGVRTSCPLQIGECKAPCNDDAILGAFSPVIAVIAIDVTGDVVELTELFPELHAASTTDKARAPPIAREPLRAASELTVTVTCRSKQTQAAHRDYDWLPGSVR
jgi:hypothetical protein